MANHLTNLLRLQSQWSSRPSRLPGWPLGWAVAWLALGMFCMVALPACEALAADRQQPESTVAGSPLSDSGTTDGSTAEEPLTSGVSGIEKKTDRKPPADSPPAETGGDRLQQSLYQDVGQRPAWVQRGDYLDPDQQAHYLLVASDPRLRHREAEEELEERLVATVREYVDEMFTPGTGRAIGIDLPYIRENLLLHHEQCDDDGVYDQLLRWRVPEDNQGMLDSDTRQAFQCFSQVKLDSEFRSWAERQWENRLVISRTLQIGLVGLFALGVLTLGFGYLAAEHKTRGFYSRRLQTVVLACVVGMALAFWWLSSHFAWL